MKKYFIGLLSVFLLLASILGTQTRGAKGQRDERGADPVLWI